MYGALWSILPGPVWVRIALLVVLIAAVLFCLVTWVFPIVDAMLPAQDVTVDG